MAISLKLQSYIYTLLFLTYKQINPFKDNTVQNELIPVTGVFSTLFVLHVKKMCVCVCIHIYLYSVLKII